jgi:hypothetical protein
MTLQSGSCNLARYRDYTRTLIQKDCAPNCVQVCVHTTKDPVNHLQSTKNIKQMRFSTAIRYHVVGRPFTSLFLECGCNHSFVHSSIHHRRVTYIYNHRSLYTYYVPIIPSKNLRFSTIQTIHQFSMVLSSCHSSLGEVEDLLLRLMVCLKIK